jgi:hypothetical protein
MFMNMEQREPMARAPFPNPHGGIGGDLPFSIVCDGGHLHST